MDKVVDCIVEGMGSGHLANIYEECAIMLTFIEHLLCSHIIPLNSHNSMKESLYYYYTHFIDEKTEIQKGYLDQNCTTNKFEARTFSFQSWLSFPCIMLPFTWPNRVHGTRRV